MAREPYFNFVQTQEILTENSQEKKETPVTMLAISTWQSRPRDKGYIMRRRSRTVVTLWQTW